MRVGDRIIDFSFLFWFGKLSTFAVDFMVLGVKEVVEADTEVDVRVNMEEMVMAAMVVGKVEATVLV